jgi:NAD(P)-dependent dehydrogenase (short-subunit alcohol dehydrogenase family)
MLRNLTGKNVLIVGNAPGMSQAIVDALHGYDYVIASNRGVVYALHADAMVSIDGNWPEEAIDFIGLRLVGMPVDHVDAQYVHMPHDIVTLEPGNVVHIRNNSLSAMRLAADAGAKRLTLIGFDPAAYEALHSFRGFVEGLAALIAELAARELPVQVEILPHIITKPVKVSK